MESERILPFRVLHADPVIGSKLLQDPLPTESAEAAVLFAAEWTGRSVVDRGVIDVSHTRLDPKSKAQAAGFVAREYATGKAKGSVVGNTQGVGISIDFDHRRDRTEGFVLRDRR